jgi:hypothetical protein
LLDAVAEAMPHYPLDTKFARGLPKKLMPYWERWKEQAR